MDMRPINSRLSSISNFGVLPSNLSAFSNAFAISGERNYYFRQPSSPITIEGMIIYLVVCRSDQLSKDTKRGCFEAEQKRKKKLMRAFSYPICRHLFLFLLGDVFSSFSLMFSERVIEAIRTRVSDPC